MTLTNYWWRLIWLFVGGFILDRFPKRYERLGNQTVERWNIGPALAMVAPYIIWTGFRSGVGDSLLSSKLQKNMSEKWLLFKKATFSDCIEGSFL